MPIDYAPSSPDISQQEVDQQFEGIKNFNYSNDTLLAQELSPDFLDNLYLEHKASENLASKERLPEDAAKMIETTAVLVVNFRDYDLAA